MDRRNLLKLVGAGGCCGAAALLASQSAWWPAGKGPSTEGSSERTSRFGFFDVDSRELNTARTGFQFRERVLPLADRLNRLYAVSEDRNYPLVFTTCCSGRMLQPDSLREVLVVPLDPAQKEWQERLRAYHLFCVQKKTFSEPKQNFGCRAFDMFKHNGNAARLVQTLGVEEWIVFGNGFDFCIDSAIAGLVAAGQKVCLLTDVYARGAKGYPVSTPQGEIESGGPENEVYLLGKFRQLGVRTATLDEFLASASKSPA